MNIVLVQIHIWYFRVPALLCLLCVLPRLTGSANPVDHHATAETRNLYHTLLAYTNNPNEIMFGQHRATAEGCSGGHLPYRLGDVHNGHQSWSFTVNHKLNNNLHFTFAQYRFSANDLWIARGCRSLALFLGSSLFCVEKSSSRTPCLFCVEKSSSRTLFEDI